MGGESCPADWGAGMNDLPPLLQEMQKKYVPYKEVYVIGACCGELVQGRTHDSLIQALLYFKERFPNPADPSIGYYTKLRNYNANHTHDWIVHNFRQRCKYVVIGADWDQTNPVDIFVKQYEYLETHPFVFCAGVKINKRNGKPLSFNTQKFNIPAWLAPDEEGAIHAEYMAFNLAMFRIEMFDCMEPPYFADKLVFEYGKACRLDGIRTFNQKTQEAKLTKVILDIKCGHTSFVENPAVENEEYFATVAQNRYIR
jgi:hypothetical protein